MWGSNFRWGVSPTKSRLESEFGAWVWRWWYRLLKHIQVGWKTWRSATWLTWGYLGGFPVGAEQDKAASLLRIKAKARKDQAVGRGLIRGSWTKIDQGLGLELWPPAPETFPAPAAESALGWITLKGNQGTVFLTQFEPRWRGPAGLVRRGLSQRSQREKLAGSFAVMWATH